VGVFTNIWVGRYSRDAQTITGIIVMIMMMMMMMMMMMVTININFSPCHN